MAKNPRRTVLFRLRIVRDRVRSLETVWDQFQTRYVQDDPSDPNSPRHCVPLTESEKRENQPMAWIALQQNCDALIEELTALREYAARQGAKLSVDNRLISTSKGRARGDA